jgi:plasmid maintenance system antidote protein VapI
MKNATKTTTKKKPSKRRDDGSFAAILRAAVTDSGASLYRLSADTGIGQDQLSRFVRSDRSLSLKTAAKLAESLGYTLVKKA